jgi:hypothetical protein
MIELRSYLERLKTDPIRMASTTYFLCTIILAQFVLNYLGFFNGSAYKTVHANRKQQPPIKYQ